MFFLSKDDVLRIHGKVLKATGGMAGVRDDCLLESAVMNCRQTFDGMEVYPHIIDKAAALAYSLSEDHPFCDGNKRTSILAALVMLRLNGINIFCSQERLVEFGWALASGRLDYGDVREWFRRRACQA